VNVVPNIPSCTKSWQLLLRGGLDQLGDSHDVAALVARQLEAERSGVRDRVEHAAVRHIDLDRAKAGHLNRSIKVDGERGTFSKVTRVTLPSRTAASTRTRPAGVSSASFVILHLFHDGEPRVRVRACWRQDEVAVGGRVAAGLAQHALADVVGVSVEIELLLEHGAAGNVDDTAGDDAPRLTAPMLCRVIQRDRS
jgi:hypothetical protein